MNPEVEIGRFLTDVARFAQRVPVAGALEYVGGDGRVTTLALLQGYVDNQGDGWTTRSTTSSASSRQRSRRPRRADAGGGRARARRLPRAGAHARRAHRRAARGASRRRAATPPSIPSRSRPATSRAWAERARGEASADARPPRAAACDALPEAARGRRRARAGASATRILARIDAHAARRPAAACERASTATTTSGRCWSCRTTSSSSTSRASRRARWPSAREKQSPLKDVAGMLRSFDYALHAALLRLVGGGADAQRVRERAGRASGCAKRGRRSSTATTRSRAAARPRAPRAQRRRSARAVPAGEGDVRAPLRGRKSSGLGAHSAARAARHCWTRQR